ncbi:flagellar hook-associated protein FlgK [Rhodovulum adriaticum]|uniref:Flagellar hook-associated protein 1 n=1 Tax=Rhodovulum adriaticum TaxID=35804 RepID=A0A4R2P0Q2_RHOAD|nr:flagellar hook-associated protein FlgK [Rhodovulum adriaticum]MBK1634787.1 flagellar hook-associated protein FlgK [Rhodovulum adriaticum]TCP27638.1 flagellar hook-associated protein 1 FlgK [Rhodovulum adriaticum]
MSLTASLHTALSGLRLATRGAQVSATNVANAGTEGYGRRVLNPAATLLNGSGAGVRAATVTRETDPLAIAQRRLAQADSGQAETRSAALDALQGALGTPDDGNGLTAQIATLEAALIAAASRPDSDARLTTVLGAAQDLVAGFAAASDRIQALRLEADTAIVTRIEGINTALTDIAQVNTDILAARARGQDTNTLTDRRQALIDGLAAAVPLQEYQRQDGTVALYTQNGFALLDGRPAQLDFSAARVIDAGMTAAAGALALPICDGRTLSATGAHAPLAGGQLEALFDQRDTLAPQVQADLDALAHSLVQRFAAPALDPSLADGAPGLFTDAGAGVGADTPAGLAGRLAINAAADPESDGALSALRDGLAAADPGPEGDGTLLAALAETLSTAQQVTTGPHAGRSLSIAALAAETVSTLSAQAARAEQTAATAAARSGALRLAELQGGVDTDTELQNLLQFEKLHAANARVIQVVNAMYDTLLEV